MDQDDDSNAIDLSDLFKDTFIDVLGFTAKDWRHIQEVAQELRDANFMKGDPFKCSIGALVLWVSDGNGLLERDLNDPALH